MNTLTNTINSYFAVLLITIAGAGATMLILHIANAPMGVTVYADQAIIYTYEQPQG